MIDRVFLGYVVDFLDFTLIDFAVFNVADSFVCIGAGLFILWYILDAINEYKQKKAEASKKPAVDAEKEIKADVNVKTDAASDSAVSDIEENAETSFGIEEKVEGDAEETENVENVETAEKTEGCESSSEEKAESGKES
jgi:hypothetical protein